MKLVLIYSISQGNNKGNMEGNKKESASGRPLTRFQVYRTLANNGAISGLARTLGKNRTVVHLVLQGKRTSRAILREATALAEQLRANSGAAN